MENRKKTIKNLLIINTVYFIGVGMGSRWESKSVIAAVIGIMIGMSICAVVDYLIIVFKKENNEQK